MLVTAVALGALGTLGALACGTAAAESDDPAPDSTSAAGGDSARTALLARADLGRIKGSPAAPVWLVVISDFQCPYCKVWHDETQPLIERDYVKTGKIRIAYLNFPISSHRNAWPAHEAAMCAAEQGKFWPVADALFATQRDWKSRGDAAAYFDSLTGTLDLDHPRLRACVATGGARPMIQADFDRSVRIGLGSTPSFLVGSRTIIGAQPHEAFQRVIDDALAEAATLPALAP